MSEYEVRNMLNIWHGYLISSKGRNHRNRKGIKIIENNII